MYLVALFFSIFVCSAVFYAINGRSSAGKSIAVEKPMSNTAKETLVSVAR